MIVCSHFGLATHSTVSTQLVPLCSCIIKGLVILRTKRGYLESIMIHAFGPMTHLLFGCWSSLASQSDFVLLLLVSLTLAWKLFSMTNYHEKINC